MTITDTLAAALDAYRTADELPDTVRAIRRLDLADELADAVAEALEAATARPGDPADTPPAGYPVPEELTPLLDRITAELSPGPAQVADDAYGATPVGRRPPTARTARTGDIVSKLGNAGRALEQYAGPALAAPIRALDTELDELEFMVEDLEAELADAREDYDEASRRSLERLELVRDALDGILTIAGKLDEALATVDSAEHAAGELAHALEVTIADLAAVTEAAGGRPGAAAIRGVLAEGRTRLAELDTRPSLVEPAA